MIPRHLTWTAIDSATLKRTAYDPENHELWTEHASGNIWRFKGVPAKFHSDMLNAANPLRYLERHIIGRFDAERVSR